MNIKPANLKEKKWFRIVARHYCAGGELKNGKVTSAAPIIRYMINWDIERVFTYCTDKNWDLEVFDS